MMTVSLPMLTPISMYVEAGSIIVTPFNMCCSIDAPAHGSFHFREMHARVDADGLFHIIHHGGLNGQVHLWMPVQPYRSNNIHLF